MHKIEEQVSEVLSEMVMDKKLSREFDETVWSKIDNISRKKAQKPVLFRRIGYGAAAVFILSLCVTVTSVVSPAFADTIKEIPVVGSVFKLIGDNGIKNAEDKGLTKLVDKTVSNNGIKLTLKDVIYDDARISIGFTAECSSGLTEFFDDDTYLKVDGKQLIDGSSIGIEKKAITENSYMGIIHIIVNENQSIKANDHQFVGKLPDKFDLGIHFGEIKNTKGNWDFTIPVSKEKRYTEEFSPNLSETYKDAFFSIPELQLAPSATEVTLSVMPTEKAISDYGTKLAPEEQRALGMQLEGNLVGRYTLSDDKGNEYEQIIASGEKHLFPSFKNKPKFLTLNAYSSTTESEKKEITKQFPITYFDKEDGKVVITKVEFLKDKTLIYYEYAGKAPDKINAELHLTDEYGQILGIDSAGNNAEASEKQSGNPYSFVKELKPVDAGQKLFIDVSKHVPEKKIKELEMKIPLTD